MWFGKAVEDFNGAILKGGSSSPQLVANTSNGFVSEYPLPCFRVQIEPDIPLPSDIRGIRVLRRPSGLLVGQAPCYGDGKSCLNLRGPTIRNS